VATRAEWFDEEVGPSFEREWPEIARRLERFLAAKGVERWLRADVIQETAARLYPRWKTLDHSQPLWNLAATIAMRVVYNHRRKESRIELVPDPVPMHNDDVHVRGLQRAQLDKTRSALQQLNADQRQVLLAEVGEALLPAGTRNRVKVLRLRARARLREELGPWAPSAIAIKLRYLAIRAARKESALEMHAPTMANSVANVVMAATLGLAGVAVGGKIPAVGPENPLQDERARLLTLAELRDVDLDPTASIRRRPPGHSRTKPGADRTYGSAPGFVDDTNTWAEEQKKEIDEQKKEIEDQKKEVDEQKKEVENQKKAAEDWAEGSKEEVEEEVEDQLER